MSNDKVLAQLLFFLLLALLKLDMPILKFTRVRCLGHEEVGQGTAYDEEPSDSMVTEVLLPLMTRPDALVLSYKAIGQCAARGLKTTNALLLTGAGADESAICSTLGKLKANFSIIFTV